MTESNLENRVSVLEQQMRSVWHAVDCTLAAIDIEHDDFAAARQAQHAAALVDDGQDIAVSNRAVADRFKVRLFVDLRRTADVEGPHRQLGAGFADRLRGNNANRFTDVDRGPAGEITAVAGRANALFGFADQR